MGFFNAELPIDTTRLHEREKRDLQRELESEMKSSPHAEQRESKRFAYHCEHLHARISNPGDLNVRSFHIVPVDISTHGLGFLHGTFVYPMSEISVELVTHDGEKVTVDGRIAFCKHHRGRIHILGMRFKKPIEVELFIKENEQAA